MLIWLLPCGRHHASTFAPVGANRAPVAGPSRTRGVQMRDSGQRPCGPSVRHPCLTGACAGGYAAWRAGATDRAGLGPTARITANPEFVSRFLTCGLRQRQARPRGPGAVDDRGTQRVSVHVRFRSLAPQLKVGGAMNPAGRGSGPRCFKFGATEARSAELQAPAFSRICAATLASRLLLRLPRCAAPAVGSFRGSKETFEPSQGLLGRRSSGESELLFA
jgi:hypothetical protein